MDSLSRSYIQKLVSEGKITLNGQSIKNSSRVKTNDRIQIALPPAVTPDILPEDIPLDILYEDGDVIVVNKPKGMVVHPAPAREDFGDEDNTFETAVAAIFNFWHRYSSFSQFAWV